VRLEKLIKLVNRLAILPKGGGGGGGGGGGEGGGAGRGAAQRAQGEQPPPSFPPGESPEWVDFLKMHRDMWPPEEEQGERWWFVSS
jgi:hypothetical protein